MTALALLADIGGTNFRTAALLPGGPGAMAQGGLEGHADIAAALAPALAALPGVRQAVLAVAGPVAGNTASLTNRGWLIDGDALAARFRLDRVRVVNDFAALAWSLPALAGADCHPLGGGDGAAGAPLAVVGPGTGLGVSCHLPGGGVLASEGGHASLAAHDDAEAAVLALLRRRFGHVSAERCLSGQGIENLYWAIAARDGVAVPARDAAGITAAALADRCAVARAALAMFCAMLGGFAGDMALVYGARGGVFIGGGICPRFPDFLAGSDFRARFEAKGRFRDWLAPLPCRLILRPDAAMLGLAALARG